MKITRYRLHGGCAAVGMAALVLTGCVGIPAPGEKETRDTVSRVAERLSPEAPTTVLSPLTTSSTHADALRFAALNNPRVRAAYFDWVKAVERITIERSLPDPQFSFQADITDMIEAAMPGLMFDLPGPKKLKLAGQMAGAEAQVKFHALAVEIQQVAFAFKRAYYQLYFLDAKISVNRETLELVGDLEQIARRQNELGKVTLQDVLRAQIEQDQMSTEITNLEDSRSALLAAYKAALGLQRMAADPAIPAQFETTPLEMNPDHLWELALRQNPRLKAMEADVKAAEASMQLARRSRIPDFAVGLEADVKASPIMARPTFGMSLPIWKDKIAAEIAAAQASKSAGEARLAGEQIMLAVELAEKSFMLRESTRNLTLLEDALLPKAKQSLEVARAGYLSGQVSFFDLLDAWKTRLDFELKLIESKAQRELAIAELSLLVAGNQPSGSPLAGFPNN
jgi:cobalt-zinc-cadmium efflux system outer membrane protein